MSEGILLFDNGGSGGGSSSNVYDQTSFADTSLPASNNTALTNTVGTNPFGAFFANDLAPKWMTKTLLIRDLVRVEDRSFWINGRPTYKIIWNDDFPGANGYLFGDIAINASVEAKSVQLQSVGDGFGVGGVIRRVQWLMKPPTSAGTLQQYLDGTATTTLTLNTISSTDPVLNYPQKTFYSAYVHAANNETQDLHDYRITANTINTMEVYGAVVYYDITGDGINCFPGTGYLNKSQITPTGSSLVFPPAGISTLLGAIYGVYVNNVGAFGLTSVSVPSTSSIAIGVVNTNLLSVSTGTGASFPVGSGVYAPLSGGSYYLGLVSNVSSDTLTVGPTLPVGISGTLTQFFKIGSSLSIPSSLYRRSLDYQPGVQNRGYGGTIVGTSIGLIAGTITPAPDLLTNLSSQTLDWRAWGFTMRLVNGSSLLLPGQNGAGLSGQTLGLFQTGVSSFLQIDGKFSAMEVEWMVGSSAALRASFILDGFAFGSDTEGTTMVNGLIRRTLFADAGVGQHSVRLSWGGSTQVALTRVIGYKPTIANSNLVGLLAEIPVPQMFLARGSANGATLYQNGNTTMALGNVKRVYADSLATSSSWGYVNGLDSPIAAGGVAIATNQANQTVSFQYFGTQYSVVGNPGATVSISVDGTPDTTGQTFNTWLGTGLTLGFHSVVVTTEAAAFTTTISAIDFLSPVGEITNLQNYTALKGFSSLVKSTISMIEPENARSGDIWVQSEANSVAYQRAFGGWQQMNLNPPRCTYYANGGQGIGGAAGDVPLIFDTRSYDGFSFLPFVGGTQFITPADGLYVGNIKISYLDKGTFNDRNIKFNGNFVNLIDRVWGGSFAAVDTVIGGAFQVYLTKNQPFFFSMFNGTSGSTLVVTSALESYIQIARIA